MRKLSNIYESMWADAHKKNIGVSYRKEDAEFIEDVKEFVKRHNLKDNEYKINPSIRSVDVFRNIKIEKDDLVNGKLPFQFGKVDGTIWMHDLNLETLENSPKEVTKDFVINSNKLKDFTGGPEFVGGNFSANVNGSLKTLDGSPKKVGGNYSIRYCTSLKDISGISPEIGKNLELTHVAPWNTVFSDFKDEEYLKYTKLGGEIKRA